MVTRGLGCDGFHPEVPENFWTETMATCEVPREGFSSVGEGRNKLARGLLLIPNNVTSERSIALVSTLIWWCEWLRTLDVSRSQEWYRAGWYAHDVRNGRAIVWDALLDMGRFEYGSDWIDQGAITLVFNLATAFERVSLPVAWARVTHFNFFKQILRVLCDYFDHQRRVQFEGCVEPSYTIIPVLPVSMWTCLLQRIVLQDALNEVMKVYPLMKPKAFVDDIRAFMEVRNEELRGVAEKVLRAMYWSCQPVKEARKSLDHAAWMKGSFRIFFKRRCWTCNQRATLGVDLRTRTKQLGATDKARRKKCNVRLSIAKKNRVFQKSYMRTCVGKQMRMDLVPTMTRRRSEPLDDRRPEEMIHSNAWRSAPSCIRLSLTCKFEKRCHCKAEDKPSRNRQERVARIPVRAGRSAKWRCRPAATLSRCCAKTARQASGPRALARFRTRSWSDNAWKSWGGAEPGGVSNTHHSIQDTKCSRRIDVFTPPCHADVPGALSGHRT